MLPIERLKLGKRLPILLVVCLLLRSNDVAERCDVHHGRADLLIRTTVDRRSNETSPPLLSRISRSTSIDQHPASTSSYRTIAASG